MTLELLRLRLSSKAFHFAPFFILGDPTPGVSLRLAREAVEAGASLLEVGIPFSDPVADGPSLQAASVRARRCGATVEACFALLSEMAKTTRCPIHVLVYSNLLHRCGSTRFLSRLAEAGASSVMVPDLPSERFPDLVRIAGEHGLGAVPLVGPLTASARVQELSRSAAFVYLTAVQGTTGARSALSSEVGALVRRCVAVSAAPVCVGFGLSTGEHLRAVARAGARIAVVGSALADRISEGLDEHGLPRDEQVLVDRVKEMCAELASSADHATRGARA
jgi:tryptophan synthase alpha chain